MPDLIEIKIPRKKTKSFTKGLDSSINPKISIIYDAFEFNNKDIPKTSYQKYMKYLIKIRKGKNGISKNRNIV